MNKFSINIPAAETRTVYGYMRKDGDKVYWLDSPGRVRYFNKITGVAGDATIQNWDYYKKSPSDYTPIYEPFSITIGA